LRRLATSLTLKLVALVGIFIALPIVLYAEFEDADRQMRDLVTRAIQDRSALIADALAPSLRSFDPANPANLNGELARYTSGGTTLRLMFQPAAERAAGRFFLIASAPQMRAEAVSAELDQLQQRGILQRLSDACAGGASDEIRYRQPDGSIELLTSIIPLRTSNGCWALTSTHTTSDFLDTSIGRPYWQTPEVRAATAAYLVLLVLALLVALSIRLSLRRFREVATEIGQGRIGDDAFSRRNTVPELSSVARDFDKLVLELRHASQRIRQSAEDKAHSFKTPIAAIRSALEPVRRAVPEDDRRARRALELIDSSLGRLFDLVIAAQRHDISTADLIEAPRLAIDLTQLIEESIRHLHELLAEREVRLVRHLDSGVPVRAGPGMLEAVVQNLLENAISFSPRGGTISVTLALRAATVVLQVDDEGPGADAHGIAHMFDRYFSSRSREASAPDAPPAEHAGLGLWIVRRSVEAMGGQVGAVNRPSGGLSVTVTLPTDAG
jgi:two-component system sensor histidine kinase ChvG